MATLDLPIPNNDAATAAIECITSLRHYKDNLLADASSNIYLPDWQREIIQLLFGTLDHNNRRRFRTLFLFIAKKNGKGFLCSLIAIYCLLSMRGQKIIAIADTIEQARNCFDHVFMLCREMGYFDDEVARYNKNSKEIEYLATGTTYKVRVSDPDSLDGVECSVAIIDELHRLTKYGPECWAILEKALLNQREPLLICMTTAGGTREEFTYQKYAYAKAVLNGEIDDPTFLPVIYETPEDRELDDEDGWRLANPAIDSGFLSIDMMRQMCSVAQTSTNEEYKFRRFNLNQFTMVDAAWIPLDKWDAITEAVDEADLIGHTGYYGLDVGINRSMTALCLCVPKNGKYYLVVRGWLPVEGIDQQSEKDQIDYRQWEREGLIRLLPGETTNMRMVWDDIQALHALYPCRELAIDPMNGLFFIQEAEAASIIAYPHRQGYAESNYPCQQLYKAVLDGKLIHGGNRVLRAHVQNVVVITNHDGLIKLSKKRSKGFSADGQKTDSVCAAMMAVGRAVANEASQYEFATSWDNSGSAILR